MSPMLETIQNLCYPIVGKKSLMYYQVGLCSIKLVDFVYTHCGVEKSQKNLKTCVCLVIVRKPVD